MLKVQSPGRINIIGEHTDYNDGFVLPAAIDKGTVFALQKNGTTNRATVKASNFDKTYTFELDNFYPIESGWENYVMGVVHELQKLGAEISGFDAEFEGDVPIGSGMSSSAALECSLAYGLNELFQLGFDKWQLIKACQMAEHTFVGTKCGIMDQFASMMGAENQVILLDCRSLDFAYLPFQLDDYLILLLNTNVEHSLATSQYNARRESCEAGVEIIKKQFPQITSLRDVSIAMFNKTQATLSEELIKRCKHVITENNRVQMASDALLKKDFQQIGQLMYQSHFSLQNDYEVSCPELDFLVQQTLDKDYILGSRMMGGGFGGCTINIIQKTKVDAFVEAASKSYKHQFGIALSPYMVHIAGGTGIVN